MSRERFVYRPNFQLTEEILLLSSDEEEFGDDPMTTAPHDPKTFNDPSLPLTETQEQWEQLVDQPLQKVKTREGNIFYIPRHVIRKIDLNRIKNSKRRRKDMRVHLPNRFTVKLRVYQDGRLMFFNHRAQRDPSTLEKTQHKGSKSTARLLHALHLRRIHEVLYEGGAKDVIVEKFKLKLIRSDLRTLQRDGWLNDNIVNVYLQLVTERNKRRHMINIHAFSTQFVTTLRASGYDGVKRWERNTPLFEKDLWLIPVHVHRSHWAMAAVSWTERSISYFDSLKFPDDGLTRILEDYIRAEWRSRDNQGAVPSFNHFPQAPCPTQSNGNDCGVFACTIAEHLARSKPLEFSAADVAFLRQKMAIEIINMEVFSGES